MQKMYNKCFLEKLNGTCNGRRVCLVYPKGYIFTVIFCFLKLDGILLFIPLYAC